jgi:hypothetical protein
MARAEEERIEDEELQDSIMATEEERARGIFRAVERYEKMGLIKKTFVWSGTILYLIVGGLCQFAY